MPEGKTTSGAVVVTGASRGIGAAVAVELEARGFDVLVALTEAATRPPAGRCAAT